VISLKILKNAATVPLRALKKKPNLQLIQEGRDQAKDKEDFESERRLAAYRMEREAKRILNGHSY